MTNRKLLTVLSGEAVSTPPIWFMRQAGRYLPEYREVRAQAGGFLDLCYDTAKATRVTMQPIERYDLDAAILFADILLIPQALGMDLWFETGEGPKLGPQVTPSVVNGLDVGKVDDTLAPIYETVASVRAELPDEKTLLGFAGAPWTVATYMLGQGGSKDPSALRSFAYREPEAFGQLIDKITEATSHYLIRQVRAGADAVQIFDSWAAFLPEVFFREFCIKPVQKIAAAVKAETGAPVIAFPRGSGAMYEAVASLPEIDGVSIDTGVPASFARERLSPHGAVQGNLDPLLVVAGGEPMLTAATALIDAFRGVPYIFNLGHGFVPETPPEHVGELVRHIRASR